MDILEIKIYLERAENEFRLAKLLLNISQKQTEVKEELGAKKEDTFYSSVIAHAYYCIFYSAKALLLAKCIKTDSPDIHKKTLDGFKKYFVDTGILDVELLRIYSKMIIRADELFGLYKIEKKKRGKFVYQTIPQANLEPAEESIENARKFLTNIKAVIKI